MNWKEKLKANWADTRLAHEAVALESLQRKDTLVQRLVRKTQNGTLGKETVEPEDAEDMGVAVGNQTHNHYYAADSPPKPPTGVLTKAAIGAALLASGAGAALTGAWALGAFDSPPAVEVEVDAEPQYWGIEVE